MAATTTTNRLTLSPLPQGIASADLQPLILQINDRLRRIGTLVGAGGTAGQDGKQGPAGPPGPPGSGGGGGATLGLIQEVPGGAIDGSNKVFTLSGKPTGVTLLFLNGVEQNQPADYTVSGDSIAYKVPPRSGDWQLILYDASALGNVLTQEVPAGALDGSNAVFTLSQTPQGLLLLFLNGIEQNDGIDYTINQAVITYTVPPKAVDWHSAVYGAAAAGTNAPGSDKYVIYNRLGKFAGDAGLQYDYTGHNVILTGPVGTGFIAPVFNSSNSGSDVAITQKDSRFHITGAGDAYFQTATATTTFNSLADQQPNDNTVPAFQTSGGDYIVYGSGDVQGQTFKATTTFNSLADVITAANPDPSKTPAFCTSHGDYIVYGSGDVQGQTFKATTTFNSLADQPANMAASQHAFQTQGGDFIVFGSGDVTCQTVAATTVFNSAADQQPNPDTVPAFQTTGGDFMVYGSGNVTAQTLSLSTPANGQICFMKPNPIPGRGYIVSGDPNFLYSTVGGKTGLVAPFFVSTADTASDPAHTPAFQTQGGDFVVYGSGDITAQTISLTTPAVPQICYMLANPIAGRGNIISGNSGFIWSTQGGYPAGVIAPLFNASNTGSNPAIVVNQGAAEIFGSGDAQFQTVKATTTFNSLADTPVAGNDSVLAFCTSQGDFKVFGSGNVTAQTVSLTTPAASQICYMVTNPISGRGNIISGNAGFIWSAQGQYPAGVIAPLFNASNTGANPAIVVNQGSAEIFGNGNAQFQNLALTTPLAPQYGGTGIATVGQAGQVLKGGSPYTWGAPPAPAAPGADRDIVFNSGGVFAASGNLYYGADGNFYVQGAANTGVITHVFNSQNTGTNPALIVNNGNFVVVNGQGDVTGTTVTSNGTMYALQNLSISGATSSAGSANFNSWIQTGQYFLCQNQQGISNTILDMNGWNFTFTGGILTNKAYLGPTGGSGFNVQCDNGWHAVSHGLIL